MIGDVMSAAASQGNFEHINLMLGKLEQLALIGVCCNFRLFEMNNFKKFQYLLADLTT